VPILGAVGPRERWRMRPPDLLTMNRCKKPISRNVNDYFDMR
jgi:hypothetical protein